MFALSGFLCFYLPRAHKNHRRHLFKMHIICVSDVLFDDVRVLRLVFWCALSEIQSIYIYMEVFNAHYLRSHVCYTMHRHSCIYPTNMYAFFCSYCVLFAIILWKWPAWHVADGLIAFMSCVRRSQVHVHVQCSMFTSVIRLLMHA